MDRYEKPAIINGIIDVHRNEGEVKEVQTVVACGDSSKVKKGDKVLINPTRYGVKKHKEGSLKDGILMDNPYVQFNIPTIVVDGKECLKIFDSDIEGTVEVEED